MKDTPLLPLAVVGYWLVLVVLLFLFAGGLA